MGVKAPEETAPCVLNVLILNVLSDGGDLVGIYREGMPTGFVIVQRHRLLNPAIAANQNPNPFTICQSEALVNNIPVGLTRHGQPFAKGNHTRPSPSKINF